MGCHSQLICNKLKHIPKVQIKTGCFGCRNQKIIKKDHQSIQREIWIIVKW